MPVSPNSLEQPDNDKESALRRSRELIEVLDLASVLDESIMENYPDMVNLRKKSTIHTIFRPKDNVQA